MTLIAIVGATGTGKSDFALDLAEAFGRAGRTAEIVNADAMQLYRGMDIGTAKLAPAERRGVPHHLLDVLEVTEEASVAAYQRDARARIDEILARDGVAVLVGGSGLYVSSVIHDFRFPGTDAAIRSRLEAELAELGPGLLHARLRSIDADTAASVDAQNGRRIVRALEVIELTGEPKAARLPDEPVPWREHRIVHLRSERARLVERLDARAARMWEAGLLGRGALARTPRTRAWRDRAQGDRVRAGTRRTAWPDVAHATRSPRRNSSPAPTRGDRSAGSRDTAMRRRSMPTTWSPGARSWPGRRP